MKAAYDLLIAFYQRLLTFAPNQLIVALHPYHRGQPGNAENVSIQEGLPCVVFSMEMGASQLALRMVGSQGRIDQQHLRTGRLDNDEWGRLTEAVEKLSKSAIFIDETPALSVASSNSWSIPSPPPRAPGPSTWSRSPPRL